MAKKKGGNARLRAGDDDTASVSSTSTAFTAGLAEEDYYNDSEVDAFHTCIDNTYENRASTREKAWEGLIGLMRASVRADDCAQSAATISGRCLNSIRKGGAAESMLAATALGLHIITLGEQDESMLQELLPDLYKLMKHGKSPAAKVAAAEALAVCCFVGSEDDGTTREVMQRLQALWRSDSAKLRAATLRAWSFLFTSLNAAPSTDAVEPLLSSLSALLHDADTEVRGAAGEAVALLYHTCGLADIEEEEEEEQQYGAHEEEEAAAATAAGAAEAAGTAEAAGAAAEAAADHEAMSCSSRGNSESGGGGSSRDSGGSSSSRREGEGSSSQQAGDAPGSSQRDRPQQRQQQQQQQQGLDDVVDRMRDLATNKAQETLRKSRKQRASLRSTFKGLCAVMEDGGVATTKVKLQHGDSLVVSSLVGTVMLNFLRRFLAGGFQAHLQGNPLLHAVFDFVPMAEAPGRMSQQEKRMYKSPGSVSSKARTRSRTKDRATKAEW